MSNAGTSSLHVLFSGRVQGVWFRATTRQIAAELPVTGFVQNLDDGRVELVVQGDPQVIQKLLHRIQDHYSDNISDITQTEVRREEFTDFLIRS